MSATQVNEGVSLKLLVNKRTNKVILAKAGKDFVDVLFSFLTMPLGAEVRYGTGWSWLFKLVVWKCDKSS